MSTGTSKKRVLDNAAVSPNPKKIKLDAKTTKANKKTDAEKKPALAASNQAPVEVDFPRGGGTTFTPLEVKTIRAEAHKEANEELFQVSLDVCTSITLQY